MQICLNLGTSLSILLNASIDSFWRTGWVYARVQHCVSFIYNGLSFSLFSPAFFCVCVCPVSVHFNAFLCYYEKQRKGDRGHLRWKALKESIEKGKKSRPMNHEFCSDMEIKEKHFDLLYL